MRKLILIPILFYLVPWIFNFTSLDPNLDQIYLHPNQEHWFGTDHLGRDLFQRVILGGQLSIQIGFLASLLAVVIGTSVGITAGWFGGFIDRVTMKFVDVFASIPYFIIVSVFTMIVLNQLKSWPLEFKINFGLIISIGFTHWFYIARQVRLHVLQIKSQSYIESIKALGASEFYTITRHVLPALYSQLVIILVAQIPSNILFEGVLSLIGLGVQAPMYSWGQLIQEGWKSFSLHPHLVLFPTFFIFLITFLIQNSLRQFKKTQQFSS